MPEQPNRREFLSSSTMAGAGWLALNSGLLAVLSACARDDAARNAAFTTLSEPESRTVRAFAAQILPSGDGLPGAEEAGAVHFIDRALGSFFTAMHPQVSEAVAALDQRASSASPPAPSFADLPGDAQIAVMRELEGEAWFGPLRFLVLAGVFSDPSYGGGRDGAGFTLLGIERAPSYSPPFGHYDAEGGAA